MKKNLNLLITMIFTGSFIAMQCGCGSIANLNNTDNPDEATGASVESQTNSETDNSNAGDTSPDSSGSESSETDSTKPEDESVNGGDSTEGGYFADAFENGLVDNNGSYFVTVDNKVYFRNISTDSMEEGAAFGEFLSTEITPTSCPLICYDLETCEWEELGQIYGIGKLYACPDGFYIAQMNPHSYDSINVQLYDPASGEMTDYCDGAPCGVSKSGDLLAVQQYGAQSIITAIVKDGEEIVSLGDESLYYEYLGFAGEDLIVMLIDANEEYTICSVDEEGTITQLGKLDFDPGELGYPEITQFEVMDGDVYMCIGFYDGTGHFLTNWEVIDVAPGQEDSLIIAGDSSDFADDVEEGKEEIVPKFYFEDSSTICYSYHLPYEAYVEGNNLYYYNDIFEECLLVEDFIKNDYSDDCQILQYITSPYDSVFVIYADAQYDTEFSIGWRDGYRMTGWHICAIPYDYGHEDENGRALEIISFTD
jgi:hypothetical protein